MSGRVWPGVLAAYRDRMGIEGLDKPITLLEGGTPLIEAPKTAGWIGGGARLLVKYEGLNPTGSFKDRGMTAAMTQAQHDGARTVICASTGNTAASAAAYAARAGMKCVVLIPDGKVALGKLAAALMYGAQVVAIRGSFDDGLRLVREISARTPIALVNSVNPARIQGQKTGAFEICDALGQAPDVHALPIGNAGNITAYWLGYNEYERDGVIDKKPMLVGAQAEGAAPLVHRRFIEKPETIASAIRIGAPARMEEAQTALRESNGHVLAVSDQEILEAYAAIAGKDGIFCEPSSAAGLAGLKKLVAQGEIDLDGATVVTILTGHGLKDPETAVSQCKPPALVDADMDSLMRLID